MIIYRATNRITGKIYIGKTVRHLYHAKARHRQRAMHRDLYGSDSYFYASIRKHGWSAFDWTIIDQGRDDTELQALERAWIAQTGSYRDRSIGYNMTPGGDGGAGRKLSPEQIAGISRRSSGKGNPGWGKFGKAHPAYGHIKSPKHAQPFPGPIKGRRCRAKPARSCRPRGSRCLPSNAGKPCAARRRSGVPDAQRRRQRKPRGLQG